MPTMTVTYLSRSEHTTYCDDYAQECPANGCRHRKVKSAEPAAPTHRYTAWISPYGAFHPVDYCNHEPFARAICESKAPDLRYLPGHSDYGSYVMVLERMGWLHVSDLGFMGPAAHKPTSAQIETLFDWMTACSAAGDHRAVNAIRQVINQAGE